MPLRSPNNPNTDLAVMNAFVPIALGYPSNNTQLATVGASPSGFGPIYVQREYDLFRGLFPAALLSADSQDYSRAARAHWFGALTLHLDYYDRYDQRPDELDDIRAAIAADLERIKANIESNDALAQNNTAYTISSYRHSLSPYQGFMRDVNDMQLVYRRYTVSFNLLPYDS